MKNSKTTYFIASTLAVVIIMVGTYRIGYTMGRTQDQASIGNPLLKYEKGDENKKVDYGLLWQALDIMDKKYIDKPIDQQKALYGAIKGALAASGDQYTTFFEPKELTTFKTELKGNFEGIGAQVDKKDDYIVIIAPIDDSPAMKAGLRAQDLIIEINGTSTQGMSLEEGVNKIRGEKGTKVKLKILRKDAKEPLTFEITRDVILVKSVKLRFEETVKDGGTHKIAVINVTRFGDDTLNLFENAVSEINKTQNISGVIIDLRNNPGGYLDSAVEMASYWLPKNKLVVSEEFSDRARTELTSNGYEKLSKYKTIILTNGGSASASEILTGALKDHNFAKSVGEKTFGKGSVQELIPLGDSGAAVKITIAKWVTPGGINLNKDGIKPDFEIKPTEEDIKEGKDVQLKKALEEVLNLTK